MEPQKYARRPFYVDAIQVTAENMKDVAVWCEGEVIKSPLPRVNRKTDSSEPVDCVKVPVLRPLNDRQTKAFEGDHVVRAGIGFKVYTNRAFTESFDPVT